MRRFSLPHGIISLLAITAACSWAVFSKPVTTSKDIVLLRADIEDLVFVEGMAGPENIHADAHTLTLYVTDCSTIHFVNHARAVRHV